jgi:hypothetical protein
MLDKVLFLGTTISFFFLEKLFPRGKKTKHSSVLKNTHARFLKKIFIKVYTLA